MGLGSSIFHSNVGLVDGMWLNNDVFCWFSLKKNPWFEHWTWAYHDQICSTLNQSDVFEPSSDEETWHSAPCKKSKHINPINQIKPTTSIKPTIMLPVVPRAKNVAAFRGGVCEAAQPGWQVLPESDACYISSSISICPYLYLYQYLSNMYVDITIMTMIITTIVIIITLIIITINSNNNNDNSHNSSNIHSNNHSNSIYIYSVFILTISN